MNTLRELRKALNVKRSPSLRLLNASERRTEAQCARLRMAFPALATLLPAIRRASFSGRTWTDVLDDYLADLDRPRIAALELEVLDLDAFVSQDAEVELLLCSILGLGIDTPGRLEYADVCEFMAEFINRVNRGRHSRTAPATA